MKIETKPGEYKFVTAKSAEGKAEAKKRADAKAARKASK